MDEGSTYRSLSTTIAKSFKISLYRIQDAPFILDLLLSTYMGTSCCISSISSSSIPPNAFISSRTVFISASSYPCNNGVFSNAHSYNSRALTFHSWRCTLCIRMDALPNLSSETRHWNTIDRSWKGIYGTSLNNSRFFSVLISLKIILDLTVS